MIQAQIISWMVFRVCKRLLTCTYKLQHVPIKHVVVGKALPVEQISKELPQVRIVWLVIKSQ